VQAQPSASNVNGREKGSTQVGIEIEGMYSLESNEDKAREYHYN
jgi:hypothetical protein